jgi:D-mannonate dehydratase
MHMMGDFMGSSRCSVFDNLWVLAWFKNKSKASEIIIKCWKYSWHPDLDWLRMQMKA